MAKTKEAGALEACNKVTLLGNKISVHMLEYLSTVKHHPDGFEQLTREFLDICRILFSIEAGLSDSADSGRRFPPDMVVELERKFRSTQSDFQELDRMVHKFLEYEHKGTVGRIQKGFRRVFPDHDIHRMRESLARSREALRMSALVFQWSLGEARIEESVGIGYTGLAAALDRIHGNRPALSGTMNNPETARSVGSSGSASATRPAEVTPTPQATDNSSTHNRTNGSSHGASADGNGVEAATAAGTAITTNTAVPAQSSPTNGASLSRTRTADPPSPPPQHEPPPHQRPPVKSMLDVASDRDAGKELNLSEELRLFPDLRRRPSTSNNTTSSSVRDTMVSTSNLSTGLALTSASNGSTTTGRSRMNGGSSNGAATSHVTTATSGSGGELRSRHGAMGVQQMLSDQLETMSIAASTAEDSETHAHGQATATPIKVVRLKADPQSMPRWSARNNAGAGVASLRTALVAAVQGANYTLMEQLLDRGVTPEAGLLHEAIVRHDVESMRLLLLFGADVNAADRAGVTPLLAAVEEAFSEGATLLIKYGADVNRAGASPPARDRQEPPLAAALATGRLGLAQLLLAYGAEPNQPVQRVGHSSSDSDSGGTDNSTTLLLSAIARKKSRKKADLLLAYGADPNAKDGHGTSPLYAAVQSSRPDIVAALLDHGADVNRPGPKHVLWQAIHHPSSLALLLQRGADMRRTPGIMELATSLNKVEAVKALIASGADVDAKKDGVYTPLCTAIRDDHIDIFQLLLASGADPNLPATEYPAWKCVTHKRVHLLPQLLAAGADLQSPPGIAELAVQVGNTETLVWLLEQGGVSPDQRSARGYTPLTTALRQNRPDLMQTLLDHGADAGARGEDWPLIMAVAHPELLERLLPAVADPRAVRGVLERAVAAGSLESVKLLLAAGVSVEDKTGGVFSPLTTALREERKDLVAYLLEEAGANPNAPGEHLPLVKAIRAGHHQEDMGALAVRKLLAHGADINKTYRGWNAVMQVLEDGNADLLRILIADGRAIDLDVADDDGRTVAQMAAARNWPEGSEILLAHAEK
ncbi:ankyrin unc44 [Grosmannia clavigera kw1407]|uniref:Ankyrin unc44 n=1 Tax=Grosmannia clavigera (strain kw1407 / UAMH 11150) TaxID=655863 RepID=F0XPH3_GROCL|nr:ankyrin unc44 [Grosmannia clavigera kw1407]EFX00162.1 ankyrin unc44 [Grosmannia clavigera kw1407]